MTGRHYLNTFHFRDDGPCVCGNNKPFGDCCASQSTTREKPSGLHIVSDFVSPLECKRAIKFADKQKREWLGVIDPDFDTSSGKEPKIIRDKDRVTQRVDLQKKQGRFDAYFERSLVEIVQPRLGCVIESFERSQLLRYGAGGKYAAHSDADYYDFEQSKWYRAMNRDVSLLIYLNDNYAGGGLKFEHLNYTYQPKAGDLVFFPSNYVYSHESLPVESGVKYALVSWSAAVGSFRINEEDVSHRNFITQPQR